VLAESGRLVLAGIALGALGALVLARSVSSLLFGIGASDPATYLATASGLASAALLASYVPARRASRVDPLVTLRAE
jgi:putative ABC transport system permease protein